MTNGSQRDTAATVEIVAVLNSRTDHLAPLDGAFSLCGYVALFAVRYRKLRPLCSTCKTMAGRDGLTIKPLQKAGR